MIKKIQQTILTVAMLVTTAYFFNTEKTVMEYLEYLPVYRVELRWDKDLDNL